MTGSEYIGGCSPPYPSDQELAYDEEAYAAREAERRVQRKLKKRKARPVKPFPEGNQMTKPNVELRMAEDHPRLDLNSVAPDLIMQDRFREVVRLQYRLSFKLAGENWLTDRDRVDTYSAMRIEAGELMESAGYKSWWVKGDPVIDPDNCVVEIVDILHFLVQGLLQDHYARARLLDPFIREEFPFVGDPEQELKFLINPVAQILTEGIELSDEMVALVTSKTPIVVASKWLGKLLLDGARAAMPHFWAMCTKYEISPALLISMYSAKNALNQFRKDNNYKGDMAGRAPYRKIWADGQEDNAHVMGAARMIAKDGIALTVDTVYKMIKINYAKYSGVDRAELDEGYQTREASA